MIFLSFLSLVVAAAPPPALLDELKAACQLPAAAPLTESNLLIYASRLVAPRGTGFGCRRDPELAIRLTRAVAETPNRYSAGAYEFLGTIFGEGRGVRRDSKLALLYRRRAWLLGAYPLHRIFESVEEERAYFASAGSIDWLTARTARGAPPRDKIRLAEALTIRRGPGDLEQVRKLLGAPDLAREFDARLLFAKLVAEWDAAPSEIADAAAVLRLRVTRPAEGEIRPLVLRLARLQLTHARTPEQRWDAIQSLAAAAYAGEAEASSAFREALLAANGGREPATVDATGPRAIIGSEDYPASALRQEITGSVTLRGLVDPRGRIVFTEAADPAQPRVLVDAVRAAYARVAAAGVAIPTPRPTPYVWVRLPTIGFRLPQ